MNDPKPPPSAGLLKYTPAWARQPWAFALFLVFATVIAYGPAITAGFVWDDDLYITSDRLLTLPDGLKKIWFTFESPSQYFPLTYTTLYIERHLWGLNPAGYHLVNILLHAANAILLWRLLRQLRVPGAWLAAAIFALHPVEVESVAWVSERKNVLMGFFFLAALMMWTRFAEDQPKPQWRYYFFALLFYFLSLASKTTACTLPAALLLILWLKRSAITAKRLAQIVPFVALGLAFGLISMQWERLNPGVQPASAFDFSPVKRLLIASRALWFYAGKIFWPMGLCANYPRWATSPSNPLDYVWLAGTLVFAVGIWLGRNFVGRGVIVALLYFAATLSPLLGFIKVYTFAYSFVADHYQYMAGAGLFAIAGSGLSLGFDRLKEAKAYVQPIVGVALLGTLAIVTWNHATTFADNETLWQAALRANPDSILARASLGALALQEGQTDIGTAYFKKALELDPNFAGLHYDLGVAYSQVNRYNDAINQYRQEIIISPHYASTHASLAMALAAEGNLDASIEEYQKAIRIKPDLAVAQNNLGAALLQKGEVDQAIMHLEKASATGVVFADQENNLGRAWAKKGKFAESIAHFQRELDSNPANVPARNNLAVALAVQGNLHQSAAEFQRVLDLNANQIEALSGLAWLLATAPEMSLRDGPKALELARRANQISGGKDPVVLQALAAAQAETGHFPEALDTARRAHTILANQKENVLAKQLEQETRQYAAGRLARDTESRWQTYSW